ncbi:MAG: CBS domain-containing protein [Bacteroidota bacterium]
MTQTTDYILNDIEAVALSDSIEEIINLFELYTYTHLPVVEKDIYCGTIAKNDLDFIDVTDKNIEDLKSLLHPVYANENMSWFEVLQLFATHNSNLLPVLNNDNIYIGYYEFDDFLNIFRCTPFLHEEGVIITISKGINDYSMSQISQIVESNNATLFGVFVSKIENETANITLKLSIHDINNTILSFRRYGYHIITEIHEDKFIENLKERSEYLTKFLNI